MQRPAKKNPPAMSIPLDRVRRGIERLFRVGWLSRCCWCLLLRVMVIVKANKESEAGSMPTEKMLTAMGRYNEELVKAGVMLAGEGLQASSKGARVRFSGDKRTVIDGPFAETKDL